MAAKKRVAKSDEDGFVTVAKVRVPRAIKSIRAVARLSHYKSTASNNAKVVAVLRKEVDAVEFALNNPGKREEVTFDL